jgi:DedD protein
MPREPELYKDKIEVSLDGRQIFYLFFGGAVIVGLVFVLGVMVGRRVEARGHVDQVRTKAATDPLAALDNLEAQPKLGFQSTLTGTPVVTEVEHKIADIEKARAAEPRKADGKKADKKADAKKPDKSEAKPEKADKPADKPEKAADKPEKAADKAEKSKPDKLDKPEASNPDVLTRSDDDVRKADKPAKGKFTLQLSSFQDRGEADAFLASVKAAGYQAYVTEADVTGKTFYRVRLGTYRSLEAANDAKADVEKALKKSASVMRL